DYYIWTDKNFTIDASATYTVNKRLRAFVELNNLSNAPVKMFMGDSRRSTSVEWYGRKGQAGLRWNILQSIQTHEKAVFPSLCARFFWFEGAIGR
ncbi:MAG: hypothetical protein J7576_20175, partial [Siphonobacter aquaeclarae]|nr:hypothetical protein [Siphonobacter aquaeclarae]